MEIKVNALMIRACDYGENDKVLTLLTAEHGKLAAGIKGVKKAGAKLRFAAQPFCLAEYILANRGGRYTVINAAESESFYDLRCDINKYYASCALCEAAESLSYEGDACPQLFFNCVKSLTEMCSGDECMALVKFLVRALSLSGYGFSVGACSVCGEQLSEKEKMRFDMASGQFTCWECGTGAGVSGDTYRCLAASCGKFAGSEITSEGKKRALRLLKEYFTVKTENRYTALSEYIRML